MTNRVIVIVRHYAVQIGGRIAVPVPHCGGLQPRGELF